MTPKTRLTIAELELVFEAVFLAYVAIASVQMYVGYATGTIQPEDCEEWVPFGCMCFMPMVLLFYARLIGQAVVYSYNALCEDLALVSGRQLKRIEKRPLWNDMFVIFAVMVFGCAVSREIYPFTEGISQAYYAMTGLVEAVTCIALMQVHRGFGAWFDQRFAEWRRRKKGTEESNE